MTLTELRRAKDLGIWECAKQVGISPAMLSGIESGNYQPTEQDVAKIAAVLGCEQKAILEGLPDPVEAAKKQAVFEKFMESVRAAKLHAKEHGLGRGKGGRGEMPCPAGCGGTLRYSVASVNGHMHAACSTAECVRWME